MRPRPPELQARGGASSRFRSYPTRLRSRAVGQLEPIREREKSGTLRNVDSTSERAGPKRSGAAADWTREGTVGF